MIETSPRLGMTIVEGVRTLLPAPGQPCLTLQRGAIDTFILNILLIYILAYVYDYSAMIFMGIVSGELF